MNPVDRMHADGVGPAGAQVHACRVERSLPLGETFRLLWLHTPEVAGAAKPGQFVMVAMPGPGFHLRRPLSIHRVRGESLALLIEERGEGTRVLAAVPEGGVVHVSGALGSGFPLDGVQQALLVGGGIGVAPLQFVADVLTGRGVPSLAYVGVREAAQLPLLDALELPGLHVATEDGSRGTPGTVVDALRTDPAARVCAEYGWVVVYACGPLPMLAAVQAWTSSCGLHGYGSLEAHLACGTGACHGCVVPSRHGYVRVCADGPVLDLDDLVPE